MKKIFIALFILLCINSAINSAFAIEFCDRDRYIKDTFGNEESAKAILALAAAGQGVAISKNAKIDIYFIEKVKDNVAKCGFEVKDGDEVVLDNSFYHRIIGERSKFANNLLEL